VRRSSTGESLSVTRDSQEEEPVIDLEHLDDAELVRRCAEGDRAAFDVVVERHGDGLYRFATRVCRVAHEAEDAVQDALVSLWTSAASYRGDAPPRTWLFQITLHACRRRSRRRAGEPLAHEDVGAAERVAASGGGAEERVGAREVGAAIDAALAEMEADAREVLLLRDVEGLSGEDTAVALGIGLAAMKSRLHRARLELKQRVELRLGHAVGEVMP
jgi:RNA polymerase sigma-70 factor (ECF subfamily)